MSDYDHLYMAGEWTAPMTDARIDVISPTHEDVIARVAEASTADV